MREVFCELTPSAVDTPVDGPYIVREPAQRTTTSVERAPEPSMPTEHPSEAARTRDGEIDPPEAAI
jgi:hypothetical protein